MKTIVLKFLLSLLLVVATISPHSFSLTIYTYDSFASKDSLGIRLKTLFEKQSGKKLNFTLFPSSGEALNQIVLEGKQTAADVIIGVDQNLLSKASLSSHFEKLNEKWWKEIPGELDFDPTHTFLPFDYGYLAFVYDSQRTGEVPKTTLQDFSGKGAWKKRVVIEDPRTSSLGLSFLVSTMALYGSKWGEFWKGFSGQLIAVVPSWSGAYGIFLKKEADFVLSYTTSPAYHIEKEGNHKIKALEFSEGHYRQVEGVGILKHSKHKEEAYVLLNLLLSREVQSSIPTTNWMYPVRSGPLPPSFNSLLKVKKTISMDPGEIEKSRPLWLRQWTSLMAGG